VPRKSNNFYSNRRWHLQEPASIAVYRKEMQERNDEKGKRDRAQSTKYTEL
jgi:hypothetical protein